MIKSEVKNEKKISREYPYLGQFRDGEIVLFVAPKTGFTIRQGTPIINGIGHFADTWGESDAEIFTGEITLSNEG